MVKRIIAIGLIFVGTSIAWMILGATIWSRTDQLGSVLKNKVASTWGTPQVQSPPTASYKRDIPYPAGTAGDDKKAGQVIRKETTFPLPLLSSNLNAVFNLEHRKKGLLWYSTYEVDFSGQYKFQNTSEQDETVDFSLPFPSSQAVYDDLKLLIDGRPLPFANRNNAAVASATVPAGKEVALAVSYRSHGMDQWTYKFEDGVAQVRDFQLKMRTNFDRIDFPDNTLSPTAKVKTANGWDLTWRYTNLVSGFQIGMTMPEKLQPGPLAGRMSFFAPVCLLFFFFIMFIITTLRGIELHPMNYFFLACAFFAFHLLMAYTVDHISIHLAFLLSSAVSIFLVVSYLRLVVGMRFALLEAGGAQFIYLILFSYAFFFEGFSALAVTIGSIITLFVVMQATGRIKWAEKFANKPQDKIPA